MRHAILLLTLAICLSLPANAKIYTVTNTSDSGAGSLRSALGYAANGDKIKFSVTGVITLTSAQLEIVTNVTIAGPGAAKLAISGNGQFTVFQVDSGVTAATISDVTIEDGYTSSGDGGGINNQGTLTLRHSILSGNTENAIGGNGGGINNQGRLTLSYSTLTGNGANGDGGAGGAVYNSGTLTVSHSTLSNNSSSGQGGGVYNSSLLAVSYSTVSDNGTLLPGAYGGGIYNSGTLIVDRKS